MSRSVEIKTHLDWYHDDVDGGTDLWRLDPFQNIQIQVSVNVVKETMREVVHGEEFGLFIEHDVRADLNFNPQTRIKYSGCSFPIKPGQARALLMMDNEQAVKCLRKQIDYVIALPSDPHFCTK
jgi:hypothetical protein